MVPPRGKSSSGEITVFPGVNCSLKKYILQKKRQIEECIQRHGVSAMKSKQNMLQRVMELFNEVGVFLQVKKNALLLQGLRGEFFGAGLLYLTIFIVH